MLGAAAPRPDKQNRLSHDGALSGFQFRSVIELSTCAIKQAASVLHTRSRIPNQETRKMTATIRRREWLLGMVAAAGAWPLASHAASGFPSGPVTLVVPFSAGGQFDGV